MSSPLTDGYPATISFFILNGLWGIRIGEKTVRPPSISLGSPINVTTMANAAMTTQLPRKLRSLGTIHAKIAYDPQSYDDSLPANSLTKIIGTNQLISIQFSDGSSIAIWGWLNSFNPDEMKEGTQPEAEIEIEVSNIDPNIGYQDHPLVYTGI